ncbi:MAG: aminotransferase class IV [Planctomycetota bacterium]|nr:aminotransferase class IV [Planctomycetota bacterium]
MFEGTKAHVQPDGALALFRLDDHLARLARSCERMCIPPPPRDELRAAIVELVGTDAAHAPASLASLYVRPLVFADQADFSPAPAEEYALLVLLAPVEGYLAEVGVRLVSDTTQPPRGPRRHRRGQVRRKPRRGDAGHAPCPRGRLRPGRLARRTRGALGRGDRRHEPDARAPGRARHAAARR